MFDIKSFVADKSFYYVCAGCTQAKEASEYTIFNKKNFDFCIKIGKIATIILRINKYSYLSDYNSDFYYCEACVDKIFFIFKEKLNRKLWILK